MKRNLNDYSFSSSLERILILWFQNFKIENEKWLICQIDQSEFSSFFNLNYYFSTTKTVYLMIFLNFLIFNQEFFFSFYFHNFCVNFFCSNQKQTPLLCTCFRKRRHWIGWRWFRWQCDTARRESRCRWWIFCRYTSRDGRNQWQIQSKRESQQ